VVKFFWFFFNGVFFICSWKNIKSSSYKTSMFWIIYLSRNYIHVLTRLLTIRWMFNLAFFFFFDVSKLDDSSSSTYYLCDLLGHEENNNITMLLHDCSLWNISYFIAKRRSLSRKYVCFFVLSFVLCVGTKWVAWHSLLAI